MNAVEPESLSSTSSDLGKQLNSRRTGFPFARTVTPIFARITLLLDRESIITSIIRNTLTTKRTLAAAARAQLALSKTILIQ